MPSSTSAILYEAAKETLVEYFQKTSLNGFGLLYYIRRRKYQRLFWFMFIAMGIAFAIYVCFSTMYSFLSEPTVTSMDTQQHTIWDTPFPAIAVCSNNKLSRTAMLELAHNLSISVPAALTVSQWLKKLELFAAFFNTDSIDFDEALTLQNQLDSVYGENLNIREMLRQLSPKCENLLVKCFWAGRAINCTNELKLVAFTRGHCCVFNYHYERFKMKNIYYPNGTGSQMGLSLLLNASSRDFFYAEESSNGFTVQLFENQKIPDISTGDVKEFFINADDDVSVKLKLIKQTSAPEVLSHPVARRGCYFPHERSNLAVMGPSACFLNCRLRSMENLCDCIPFYAFENKRNVSQCSLSISECLERFRVTWQTYNPTGVTINEHLKAELLDSLSCPECLPLCSYNRYAFQKTVNNLRSSFSSQDNKRFLKSIPQYMSDFCLLKIYYQSKYGVGYQKNVLFNWYQILSNIGGVIGICMGCSIISGYEIFHFGVVRLLENFLKIRANQR